MKFHYLSRWLGAALLLVSSLATRAQPTSLPGAPVVPPAAPAPVPAAPLPAAPAPAPAAGTPGATDVLLLTTGQELAGRVLTITPTEVSYVPTARPDTVHLPVASVFLVRYANGTREVLSRPTPAAATAAAPEADVPPALRPLSLAQRRIQGERDAQQHYRADGPFWGSLGSTLYFGPILGLVTPIVISDVEVKQQNFNAPQPTLLVNPTYKEGYQFQANHIKRRRAWTGYGIATGVYVVLLAAVIASLH